MSEFKSFHSTAGKWKGVYHLWLDQNQEPALSQTTMEIKLIAMNRFIQMQYSWLDKDQEQTGILLIGYNVTRKKVVVSWIDTWHNKYDIMNCEGAISSLKYMWFKGSYSAPEGPNWEWKTKIKIKDDDNFLFEMYNISPQGNEALAVKVEYSRF